RDSSPGLELLKADGSIGTREAQDDKILRSDPHLNRFAHLIATMIDRIREKLLNGREWEVRHPRRFGTVGMLKDRFVKVVSTNVVERLSDHPRQRTLERFLC